MMTLANYVFSKQQKILKQLLPAISLQPLQETNQVDIFAKLHSHHLT